MFIQQGETKKLWQKIGLDRHQSDQFNSSDIELVDSDKSSSKSSAMQSLKQSLIQQKLKVEMAQDDSRKVSNDVRVNDQKTQKFQHLIQKLSLQVRQIEQSQQIIVSNDQYQVQQPSKDDQESSGKCEELDSFYNQDLSRAPESVTPLVYSKNSKKAEEVRFRKENARLVLLKLNISDFKKTLRNLKQQLQSVFGELKGYQQSLREEICSKYYELQRQYSMKVQESIFYHKQEYQQLKYHYQILKSKEQATKNNVPSQFVSSEIEFSAVNNSQANQKKANDLLQQNQKLKEKLGILQSQKEKLVKESSGFKKKIAEIQGFTAEIKQSNDKLYEYVFDLEQQLAFHKEEIPKIRKVISQEMEDYYRKQLQNRQAQQTLVENKSRFLQSQLRILSQEKQKLKKEAQRLRLDADSYKLEEAQLLKLNEERVSELLVELKQKEQEIENSRKLIQEKDIMIAEYLETINRSKLTEKATNNWEYSEPKAKTREKFKQPRMDAQLHEQRQLEDRKLFQALEIDKMVLQKQNMQLKATIQFYNKMANNPQTYQTPTNRHAQTLTNYYIARDAVSSEPNIPESNLYLKERELLKYQGFLQSQAQRLEVKQKEMELQMTVRKNIEQKYKENYNVPERVYEMTAKQDDYGMKHIPTHTRNHHNLNSRKNNFCSSEAQAIIEKVKMRQIRRPEDGVYQCRCQDIRNCRCQVLSRASRGSRDSNSRDYIKMQHYRPNNYSPATHADDYLRKDEKSSKMKMIEDKVKRLKSELKNSLSSMKD